MSLDLTNFWEQLLYPINNIILLLIAGLLTLLTEEFIRQLKIVGWLEVIRFDNVFWNGLLTFLLKFIFAFFMAFTTIFIMIALISIILAIIGSLLIYI